VEVVVNVLQDDKKGRTVVNENGRRCQREIPRNGSCGQLQNKLLRPRRTRRETAGFSSLDVVQDSRVIVLSRFELGPKLLAAEVERKGAFGGHLVILVAIDKGEGFEVHDADLGLRSIGAGREEGKKEEKRRGEGRKESKKVSQLGRERIDATASSGSVLSEDEHKCR
jgi:hypothetical protein